MGNKREDGLYEHNNGKLPSAEKFISNWIVRWIFLSHKTSKPFLSIRSLVFPVLVDMVILLL